MKCSVCGFVNQPGMKFCGQCGAELAEKEYGERRNATIYFADLSGYTPLSETSDPEEVKDLLDTIFTVVADAVDRYSGFINKYIGDCAMCVFGYPKTIENHPEKALLSLLLIYSTLDEIFKYSTFPVKLHTGVASGLTIIERFSLSKTQENTIIGDTVNVASRLQTIAKPGEILVNYDVWKRTKNLFIFEEMGDIQVKGREQSIRTFRLVGRQKRIGKIRGMAEVEAPMIGREEELEILEQSFENYLKSRAETVVIISGEAGIGKSRLFDEFKRVKKNITFLEAQSLSYETEPLFPLIAILKRIIEFKGQKFYKNLFPDDKIGLLPVEPFIQFILTGEVPRGLKATHPDQLKQQKFFALEEILRKFCEKDHVVICFDDLHWADDETLDFLRFLFASTNKDAGLFSVFISRPPVKDDNLDLFFKFVSKIPNAQAIKINPLTYEECKRLTAKLLEIEQIPETFRRELIFNRSEGNPLFIEELIKILIENGVLVKVANRWEISKNIEELPELPSTIDEIILGLVGRLDEKEQKFLRAASIIGQTFFKEGVEGLLSSNGTEDLLRSLTSLDFIVPESGKFLNFSRYRFKHVLMQRSIYNSILRRHRRFLHHAFAKWLEGVSESYPDEIPYSLLADHFDLGGDSKKAFIYNEKAAIKARNSYANTEAIRRYQKTISLLKDLPEFADRFVDLQFSLGRIYSRLGENRQALNSLDLAFNNAKSDKDKCRVLQQMGEVYQQMSNYPQAYYYFSLADGLAKEDDLERFSILRSKAWVNFLEGNLKEFKSLINEARTFLDKIEFSDEKEKFENSARLENLYGVYFAAVGNIVDCLKHYTNALNIYEKVKDLSGMSVIYNNLGSQLTKVGRFSEGIKNLQKSHGMDKKIGNYLGYAIVCNNLAECYEAMNQIDKAETYYNEYLQINKKINNRLGDGYAMFGLGNVNRRRKRYDMADNFYNESIKIFDELGSEIMKKTVECSQADLYIGIGREKEGLKLLELVQPYATRNECRELLVNLHLSYIKFYLNQKSNREENLRKAKLHLDQVSEILKGMDQNLLVRFEWAKVNLEYHQLVGETDLIEEAKTELKSTLKVLVDGIEDDNDRELFLNREDIKKAQVI